MSVIHWLLGAIGAGIVWFFWEIVGDAVNELVWMVTAPVRRPIWRAFVRARWPWPLLVMVVGGALASFGGMRLFHAYDSGWRAGIGMGLFLVGAFFAVGGGFLWRDAKRERASATPGR